MRKIKPGVVVFQNIIAPYRLPMLSRLAESVELDVIYASRTESRREWTVPEPEGFRHAVLRSTTTVGRCLELVRRIRLIGPSVVLSGGSITMPEAYAAAVGAKAVGARAGFFWEGNYTAELPAQWIRDQAKRGLLRVFDFFVVPGYGSWDHLRGLGVGRERLHVATNSVEMELWQRNVAEARAVREEIRLQMGLRQKIVLYVGRIAKEKQVDRLISEFLRTADSETSLLVVGSGPDMADLRASVRDSRVVFSGFREGRDLAACFAVSDVHVLASEREPWGLVVNEAMAAGLPSIVSDRVGAREMIIEGFNGRIIPYADQEALGAALREVLGNLEECKIMGERARLICSIGFTPDRQAAQFSRALHVEARRGGAGGRTRFGTSGRRDDKAAEGQ